MSKCVKSWVSILTALIYHGVPFVRLMSFARWNQTIIGILTINNLQKYGDGCHPQIMIIVTASPAQRPSTSLSCMVMWRGDRIKRTRLKVNICQDSSHQQLNLLLVLHGKKRLSLKFQCSACKRYLYEEAALQQHQTKFQHRTVGVTSTDAKQKSTWSFFSFDSVLVNCFAGRAAQKSPWCKI